MHHNIPLPRGWNRRAKSAILHILALAPQSTCWNNGLLHSTS